MFSILDVRPELLRSSSTLSLSDEMNAISIPEKKAENIRTIVISMMIIVIVIGVWWGQCA